MISRVGTKLKQDENTFIAMRTASAAATSSRAARSVADFKAAKASPARMCMLMEEDFGVSYNV